MRLITFDNDIITGSQAVSPKYAEGIIFRNVGDVDATIDGIPFPAGSVNDDFNNNFPGDVMKNSFKIEFKTGTGGVSPMVAVIRRVVAKIAPEQECKYTRNGV